MHHEFNRDTKAHALANGFVTAASFDGQPFECDVMSSGSYLMCDGVYCSANIQIRAPEGSHWWSAIAVAYQSRPKLPIASVETGGYNFWRCDNGCTISEVFDDFHSNCSSSPETGWPNHGGGGGGPTVPPLAIEPCTLTDVDIDGYLEVGSGGLSYDPVAAAITAAAPCLAELASKYRAWVLAKADAHACHGNTLCKKLYANYFDGLGVDYEFSTSEFNDIKANACAYDILTATSFSIGANGFYRQVCSFYAGTLGSVLGVATVAYKIDPIGPTVVGVFDRYDMDFRIRRKPNGNVAIGNIIATMAAATLPMLVSNPVPFVLHYGVVDPAMP